MSLCTLPLKLWQALTCHHMLAIFIPFDSCWGRLQPGLDACSVLSLSDDCLMNNPQSRASLDYLMVNIKSLQI